MDKIVSPDLQLCRHCGAAAFRLGDSYVYPSDFTDNHVIKPRNDGSSVR